MFHICLGLRPAWRRGFSPGTPVSSHFIVSYKCITYSLYICSSHLYMTLAVKKGCKTTITNRISSKTESDVCYALGDLTWNDPLPLLFHLSHFWLLISLSTAWSSYSSSSFNSPLEKYVSEPKDMLVHWNNCWHCVHKPLKQLTKDLDRFMSSNILKRRCRLIKITIAANKNKTYLWWRNYSLIW